MKRAFPCVYVMYVKYACERRCVLSVCLSVRECISLLASPCVAPNEGLSYKQNYKNQQQSVQNLLPLSPKGKQDIPDIRKRVIKHNHVGVVSPTERTGAASAEISSPP